MLLTLVLPSTMSLSCNHHHLLGQAFSHVYDMFMLSLKILIKPSFEILSIN